MKEEMVFTNIPIESLTESVAKRVFEKIQPFLPPPPKEQRIYISRKEVGHILGVSLPTVDSLTKQGLLKKLGSGIRGKYLEDQVIEAVPLICKSKYKRR